MIIFLHIIIYLFFTNCSIIILNNISNHHKHLIRLNINHGFINKISRLRGIEFIILKNTTHHLHFIRFFYNQLRDNTQRIILSLLKMLSKQTIFNLIATKLHRIHIPN